MSKNQNSCLRTRKETDMLKAELSYEQTVPAVFLRRLNRFVAEVEAGGKTVAIDLFQTKEGNDDEAAEYCASSTESPYTFALASYSANKFLKNPDELLK